MKPSEIRYEGFYSRYPFNKWSRKNKEILYEGPTDELPEEYNDLRPNDSEGHKFCTIYKRKHQN